MRVAVRHVVDRMVWRGSLEVAEKENSEREVKERYLRNLEAEGGAGDGVAAQEEVEEEGVDDKAFWDFDEGLDEIRRIVKEA